ncbi:MULTISPECIES: hypothetical protein [unclassified Microbacterium]|uniref:hypothetical protein n=1 Tax=unclassified Microbacterium TaxID=2609290 RepID=UPI000AC138F2|nr:MULTISPECIES: hypothetical protein [unclassified Microbacterium]MBN9215546.1 hypothetical protein [Microbacterium sp.]
MNGLGRYEESGQLDHDVRMRLDEVVSDLVFVRDVDYDVAWRAVRRVARGGGR